jgi:hypothetical protein
MRTLAVSLHPPLAGRAPDATSAATRDALWLGRGLLAITGLDGTRPAGLTLVDTRRWSARKVDSRATAAAVAGGTLLATSVFDSRPTAGSGLTGYSLRGRRRFHRYGDAPLGVVPVGRRVLVADARGGRVEMLDARTGRLLRRYGRLYAHPIFGDQPFPPTAAG